VIRQQLRIWLSVKPQVQVAKGPNQPATKNVDGSPQGLGTKQFHIFKENNEQGGGGACSYTGFNNLKLLQQFFKTVDSPPLIVLRVCMKWVTKRDHYVNEASRTKYPKAFGHSLLGTLNMLKYRIAFDGSNRIVCEGETVDVRNYVDSRSGKQVDIQE